MAVDAMRFDGAPAPVGPNRVVPGDLVTHPGQLVVGAEILVQQVDLENLGRPVDQEYYRVTAVEPGVANATGRDEHDTRVVVETADGYRQVTTPAGIGVPQIGGLADGRGAPFERPRRTILLSTPQE